MPSYPVLGVCHVLSVLPASTHGNHLHYSLFLSLFSYLSFSLSSFSPLPLRFTHILQLSFLLFHPSLPPVLPLSTSLSIFYYLSLSLFLFYHLYLSPSPSLPPRWRPLTVIIPHLEIKGKTHVPNRLGAAGGAGGGEAAGIRACQGVQEAVCACVLLSCSLPDRNHHLRHKHTHTQAHRHTYIHAMLTYTHAHNVPPPTHNNVVQFFLFSPGCVSFQLLNHILSVALFLHGLGSNIFTMSRIHDLLQIIDCSGVRFLPARSRGSVLGNYVIDMTSYLLRQR